MTVFFVTASQSFRDQDEAESYAQEQSRKTGRRYNVIARDEEQLSLLNVATYVKGERKVKPPATEEER